MTKKKVLIIGGGGYVGTALSKYLSTEYDVETSDLNMFADVDVTFDAPTWAWSAEALAPYDVVILTAGHSSVKMSNTKFGHSTIMNNVWALIDLVSQLRPDQRFIYMSSSSVYGDTRSLMAREVDPLSSPNNYYDLSKQMIDQYMLTVDRKNWYGLRLGTVNGPAPHIRTDVMLNAMTYKAITEHEISLFNPDTNRPILSINDLCRAVKTIIDYNGEEYGLFNLASINSTSGICADIVSLITKAPVRSLDVEGSSKLDSAKYNFSISTWKFERVFGFQFEDGEGDIVMELMDLFNGLEGVYIATTRSEPVEISDV